MTTPEEEAGPIKAKRWPSLGRMLAGIFLGGAIGWLSALVIPMPRSWVSPSDPWGAGYTSIAGILVGFGIAITVDIVGALKTNRM